MRSASTASPTSGRQSTYCMEASTSQASASHWRRESRGSATATTSACGRECAIRAYAPPDCRPPRSRDGPSTPWSSERPGAAAEIGSEGRVVPGPHPHPLGGVELVQPPGGRVGCSPRCGCVDAPQATGSVMLRCRSAASRPARCRRRPDRPRPGAAGPAALREQNRRLRCHRPTSHRSLHPLKAVRILYTIAPSRVLPRDDRPGVPADRPGSGEMRRSGADASSSVRRRADTVADGDLETTDAGSGSAR